MSFAEVLIRASQTLLRGSHIFSRTVQYFTQDFHFTLLWTFALCCYWYSSTQRVGGLQRGAQAWLGGKWFIKFLGICIIFEMVARRHFGGSSSKILFSSSWKSASKLTFRRSITLSSAEFSASVVSHVNLKAYDTQTRSTKGKCIILLFLCRFRYDRRSTGKIVTKQAQLLWNVVSRKNQNL